jgi:hypothetical protein
VAAVSWTLGNVPSAGDKLFSFSERNEAEEPLRAEADLEASLFYETAILIEFHRQYHPVPVAAPGKGGDTPSHTGQPVQRGQQYKTLWDAGVVGAAILLEGGYIVRWGFGGGTMPATIALDGSKILGMAPH